LLRNHHAFESKVAAAQEVQVAQVNRVARERPDGLRVVLRTARALKDHAAKDADLKVALRAKDHAAKDADLKVALRAKDHAAKDADLKAALRAKDHAAKDADLKAALRAKDHAAKDADLKADLRTALQEALALKDQAEEDQAEKECGVRIPNDSSSGPWNSIVMAMASSIATS
jgi:hypothetical protein